MRVLLPTIAAALAATAMGTPVYVNGGFEATESIHQAWLDKAAEGQVVVSPRFAQVWQINVGALLGRKAPARLWLVEDEARAHGGRCALELAPGEIFLPGLPVRPGARVTARFWATGKAAVTFGVRLADEQTQHLYPPPRPVGDGVPDTKGYVQYACELTIPEGATRLWITLGAADGLVDDVELDVEGLLLAAPDLSTPGTADDTTLVLANGDRELPEGSAFTGKLVDGRFGQAYQVVPESLLQVPGPFGALRGGGTIELWMRPSWVGWDEQDHNLAGLANDGYGYTLARTRYNHLIFSGSEGWGKSLGNVQSQHWMYANRWGAGDWHHVAVSWTPSWYVLFVDGYPVDTVAAGGEPGPNRSWCSGQLPSRVTSLVNLGSAGTDLDEVRISKSARYYVVAGEAPPAGPTEVAAAREAPPTRLAVHPQEPPNTDLVPDPRPEPVEFFVAGESPNASDDNPGTAERPFRTITRGIKELRPGDTLTVRGGTYREGVEIDLVGSAEHPITIRAAEGETVVIKGSEVVTGWTRDGDVWRKEGWTKEFVLANHATGTRLAGPNVMEVYQRDGLRGEALVLFRVRSAEELREGKCYWDEATGTITIHPYATDPPFDPNAAGVEVAVRARGMSIGRRHVHVRGFQFRQFGTAAVVNWPAVSLHGADSSIEDCLITWADFGGLGLSGFRNVARRCEASYCGCTGFGAGVGEGMVVEDCVFNHNNFWRYSPGWHAGGAKIIPWFNRSVVRNSEFAYNYGPGLWLDGSCNENVLEGNRCHDNEGPGIMVEISRDNVVRNNLCFQNRNTLPGIDISPVAGKGYAPTVCQAIRSDGGGGGQGIFVSSSPGTKVYHNLCYRNEGYGIFAEWALRESSDIADYAERKGAPVSMSTHDVDIRNNLLINNGTAQLSLRRNGVDEDTYNNRSDYNLLYSSSGAPLVIWGFGGERFTKLDKWQQASGFDQHSVVAAPMFEFSPGLDFRLQPDSAGVDQAEPVAEVEFDAAGRRRPQGERPDMGPYEIRGTRRILERPVVPTGLTYFSVDLSRQVNRAFADERADDGQGGWSDQGPTTDLRMFPTGPQVFGGVPFTVLSPLGCVVLKSGFRPQSTDLPDRVTIEVNRKADVLYFLHSGAWIGSGVHHWTYIIHRGDGTQQELRVVGGENLRDWSDPNADLPFDREFPTTTQVAWGGRNQTFDKVSVYMMAFVNTHDWCNVTHIEMIAAEGGGVPILIAITGGVKP